MNRTRRLMAILLSIMVFLSSMPFGVLAETLMEEEHVHAEPDAEALYSTESSACEHANVEWSDTASILLENLKDPAFNEPYSESKHLYTGPVTRSGFCPDCEITLTREEESAEPYYESHSFGLDGLCSVCGLDPVCDHAGANWFDEDPSAADYANPDYFTCLSGSEHVYSGPITQVGVCPDCGCSAKRAVEQASITEIHSYADGSRICEKCGYETECTHPDMYMVNWDASTEDLGLAKNYVQKDAEHHTYIGPAALSLYCEDCGLHTQETVESASIDMAHDLAITTACGYCGYSTTAENPDASCAHENAEPVVYFLNSNSSEGPFEYIACGDGTHTYVGPGSIRYECADCGETFEVDYDEIRYTEDCSQDQYGVCNTCDYDYSCAHANKVVSDCELLTEGAHSFTDTSERVHTYSGSANVTYSCAECHSAWVVHHEDYTAEFAHTYGGDSVCDTCGREIACRHADSKAIRVAEGSGSYARAYWNTHYYTGSGTVLFECRDCGGAYTVTSDSHEKVLMDCVFVHDLYCQFCDADKYCLHKSGDYTLTPVDGSFAALPDGKNHRFTGKYIFALVTCDECGAFDETLSISNSYYDEPHAFSEGVCTVCGYACEHENAAWREEILPDDANPGNFTPADSRTHDYTGPAAKTGDCPDCGETVSTPLNETVSLTGLAHTYDGDVCTACGYENTCVHGELYTVEGEGSVVECEPLDDGYTHAKTVAHAVHTRCADCGVLLGSRTVSETFNEAHSASGCAECGYVCPHVYSKSETVYSADEFYFHSKTEHLFIGEMEVTETCRHCGEIILHYIREDYTCYLPHEYDANNVCTACGYESACEHSYTDHVIERDRAYLGQSVPVDAFCDLYTSPAIEYAWCELCGTLRQTVTEPVSAQYPHEFVNGKCIWCNYEHSCLHPEEAIERTYTATDSSCKCERVDDSYHIFVSGTYLLEGICTLCGDTVLNRYIDADGILERHDSNNFGLCQNCQTTNLCSHIGHGIAPEFDPARADEFVYEIVSDSAHRITGPARLSGVCSGCGEALDEEGVFTIEENHTFGEDGICTACSYFSGCAHPSLLRYEILVPSVDGTFAPAENGHIFTGVCTRETWCASCGLMIASEPTESGVFEFDHVFADGVCIHCGAEGSCDHANTQQWIETELTGEAEYSSNLYHTTVGSRYRITACTDCGETLENKLIKANIAVNEPHTDNGSNRCADCGGVFVCSHSGAVDQVSIDYDSAEFAPYDEIQHKIHGNLIITTYCPACRTMLSESEVVAAGCTMLEVHIFDENHVCMLCGYDSGYECTHENLYTERQMIPSWSEPMNDGQHLSCGCMYVMELCMDCGALVRSEMEGGLVEQAQDHSYSNGVCTECYHVGGCAHSHWESISYDQVLQTADVRDSHHTLYIGSFTACLCSDCGEEFNVRMDGVSMQDEAHLMDNGYYCSVCYYYGSVPATSISAGSKLTLGVGTTHQLKPAVQPANATGKMTYSSSKTSVAKVDENGLITAVKTGTATITVKCGAKSAKVTVTVKKAPSSIKLSPAAGTLGVGQTGTLKYTLSSGSAGTVSFVSGNPAVATVDENGKVTAVGAGTAVITAITQNGKTAKSTITVKPAPSKITLSTSEYVLGEMQSFTLKASVNEGSLGTITFQSLNPDIASVSANGVITARHTGFATIVASAQNGVAASCRVEVKPGPSCVTVTEDQLILGVKQTHKIGYVLGAENEDCMGSVTFSSSKPKVASVDANGKITALRTGTTVITLTTQNDKTARVTVTVKKAPSSIKLSPTSTTLGVGDSGTLKYTLSSGSAAAVQFSSSDTSVAAVDENGVVTAVSVGSATITAKTHNGKKATCKITVKAAPTSIALNHTELILGVQQTAALSGSVNEGSAGAVKFESLNPEFATINSSGKITAVAVGFATLRAYTYNGVDALCKVEVKPGPSCVTVTEDQLILGVKQTRKIDYVLGAENEDCMGSVTFSSSKPKVASVDANGKITALRTGTTVITLTTQNDKTARVTVTVKKAPSSIKLSPTSTTLGVGDSGTLKYTLSSGSAAAVQFSSSDTSVAAVDENGVITAVSVGSASITAKTHNGKKATCKVTVKAAPTSIELNSSAIVLTYGETFDLNHKLSENSHSTVRYSISGDSGITVDPVSGAAKVTEMCPVERHAVITASTHVEGVTAQCEVTVPADPTEVFITSVPVLGVKMTGYLTAATDTAGSITFHCDANSYFTLSSDGKITAKKAGTAMVYAKTFNGIVSEPVAVTISPAPSKVVIPATLTLGVGEAHLFTPEFGSESEVGTCTFKSSKSATASISAEGLLTAKKAGSVTITVTTHNGKKDTCKVTIKKAPTSVTLNAASVTVGIGESFNLKGSVNSGAGGVVKFDTADTSLIQVSKSGNITGLELGTAVVRGYTYNEQEAFCTVEVVPAAAELTVPESMLLGLGEVNTLNIAAKDADGQPYKGSVSVKFSSAGVVSHSDGTIVALKKGSTIATVTAGNLSAACKITVKNYSEVHTAVAVAHRGGKNYWPENTLEAFTNMTSTGADMVELDVQTTKDGLQILNHDLYLTVNGQKHYISDYTYEELLAMKPNLCTLDQALEVISATGMTLQLELKDGATTTKCVDAIRKYGMQDRTIYISFNTTKLQEVRDYDPTASLGMCFESIPSDLMETAKKLDLEVIFPKHKLITEARLLSWHKAGLDVGAWTLNTPELIRKFLKMGVDYITSDSPDLIVKEIAKL